MNTDRMISRVLLIVVFIAGISPLAAQQILLKGSVKNAKQEALAGATISINGSEKSIFTDAEGRFTLPAQKGDLIRASYIGYRSAEIRIQDDTDVPVTFTLSPDEETLQEVIVTGALGIKRSARKFGASATVVGHDELNQGKTVNPLFGLTSKVSGLRINMYDSKVDPQIQINLRGSRSLSRSAGIDGRNPNAPIYVVDGMPIPDISRLNPNDIESISVLKGANAAALYGSEGVNGAIMITTKSGRKGAGQVRFSHTSTLSSVYLLPPAQTRYGQGNNGVYDPTQYESWGPEFDGTMKDFGLPLPDGTQPQLLYAAPERDNRRELFQHGLTQQYDLSFSGGDDRSTYFMSGQHVAIKGIIPNDKSNRTSLRFNGSRKFGALKTSYALNYIHNNKNTTPDGPWVGAYRLPANYDFSMMKDWNDPNSPGNPLNYFTSQGSWLRNPYFLIDNIRDESRQQTLNGKIELDYTFAPWFKALYRAGLYTMQDETRSSTRKFEAPGTRNTVGRVNDGVNSYQRINSDLILNFEKKTDRFSANLLLGQNIRSDNRKQTSIGAGNLLYPDILNPDSREGELTGSVGITEYRSAAAYGELTIGYNDFLYLTVTGRNDWVSVLSPENRSYFYPGISLSFIASDALEFLRNSQAVSYAKLYASWNKTGNVTLSPYQLNNAYTQQNGFPFGGMVGFLPGLTNPNANIQPEFVTSYEAGMQISLLNNRLHLEGAYAYSDSKGQIFNATTSSSTGYNSARVNAGRLTNRVIELSVSGQLIKRQQSSWTLGFNFTHIDNRVRELYEGLNSINNFRQSYAVIGQQFPSLLVSDYKRDPQGRVVVDAATGDPLIAADNTHLGTLVPPFQMGISNQLSIGRFALGAQFDWRMGGWLYSEIVPAMYAAGTDPRTAAYDRQPFVWPNSVVQLQDGKYQANTDLKTSGGGRAFWSKQGEVQINTAAPSDFFKLRELNLSYTFSPQLFGNGRFIREASIALIATNLFILRHADNRYGDPEYLYNNTDGYLSFRQVPPYRTVGINLDITF